MDISQVRGLRVRELRQRLRITQCELAVIVGCAPKTIMQVETGRTRHPRYLPRIAAVLGTSSEALERLGESTLNSLKSNARCSLSQLSRRVV